MWNFIHSLTFSLTLKRRQLREQHPMSGPTLSGFNTMFNLDLSWTFNLKLIDDWWIGSCPLYIS